MSAKLEIYWTPMQNKFITWGSEISLYEVESTRDVSTPYSGVRLSSTTGAHLLASNSMHHYVKCIDIYPKSDPDLLLAIGQANGKITLVTFGPSQFDVQGLPGKEFVPRHPRQCNVVKWNPVDNNIIAGGLEKYRSDHSVLLWDIMKCPSASEINGTGKHNVNNVASGLELARPIAEYGLSETTYSLAWFNTNNKFMAVGSNLKNIKLIDFRDSSKAVNSTLTKCVFGICIDPYNDKHVASYFDNQVSIWDTRNFEKPLVTLAHNKPVIKIDWCLSRHNLLATLEKDSSVINLYDIQHTMVGTEEVEPSVLERVVTPGSPHNITSFSWHSSDENRLLAIALSGSITDYTVFDRITLNWAPNSNIVWTYGRKTMKCISENNNMHKSIQDISCKIRTRATEGYGLKEEFWKNGELVDEEMLENAWNWLSLSKKLIEDGVLRGFDSKHPGVRSVLKMDATNASEMTSVPWMMDNPNVLGSAKIYKHEDRDRALRLCGWHFDRDIASLAKFLERLEKEHSFYRAAAIAVFNLKIVLAWNILKRAADSVSFSHDSHMMNAIAMALAGFSDNKNSMWKQLCASMGTRLTDPYLRAIFAFLTTDNYNYDNVLNENGMSVEDRVAFACLYLPDLKLHDYLKSLSACLIEEGNLDGLLLTGNTGDGVRLLQKYLDATGDIQSTTLIAVKAFPGEQFSETVKEWVANYRNLLDTWRLWNERAFFDIMLSAYRPADKPAQQVYVSCNFCGKSISAYMQGLNRGRGPFSRMGGTANKLKVRRSVLMADSLQQNRE